MFNFKRLKKEIAVWINAIMLFFIIPVVGIVIGLLTQWWNGLFFGLLFLWLYAKILEKNHRT